MSKKAQILKKVPMLLLLLLGAHLNLTALVPAAAGQAKPPWWVGGGLLWPFFLDTNTLLPAGGIREVLTPILGIASALLLLLAAGALVSRRVPTSWLKGLVVAGTVASLVLQVIWLSGWTVLPIIVDIVLLWMVFRKREAAAEVRGPQTVRVP